MDTVDTVDKWRQDIEASYSLRVSLHDVTATTLKQLMKFITFERRNINEIYHL